MTEFDGKTEPGVPEPCSCDEALELRARVRGLESERDVAREGGAKLQQMLLQQEHGSVRRESDLQRQLAAVNALLHECTELVPNWPAIERARVHLTARSAAPRIVAPFGITHEREAEMLAREDVQSSVRARRDGVE